MLRIRQLYIFHVSEFFLLFFQENHIPKESSNNFQLAKLPKVLAENKKKITRSCLVLFEKPCSLCSPWGTMALWVGCHDLNPGWFEPPWGLNSHWISKWSWTWFRKDLYTHCKDSRKLKVGFFPLPKKTRLPWLLAHILHREKDSGHHLTQVKRLNSGNFCGCIYCAADNLSTWYHGSDSQPFREKNIFSPHMWPMLIS